MASSISLWLTRKRDNKKGCWCRTIYRSHSFFAANQLCLLILCDHTPLKQSIHSRIKAQQTSCILTQTAIITVNNQVAINRLDHHNMVHQVDHLDNHKAWDLVWVLGLHLDMVLLPWEGRHPPRCPCTMHHRAAAVVVGTNLVNTHFLNALSTHSAHTSE